MAVLEVIRRHWKTPTATSASTRRSGSLPERGRAGGGFYPGGGQGRSRDGPVNGGTPRGLPTARAAGGGENGVLLARGVTGGSRPRGTTRPDLPIERGKGDGSRERIGGGSAWMTKSEAKVLSAIRKHLPGYRWVSSPRFPGPYQRQCDAASHVCARGERALFRAMPVWRA